MEHSQLSQEDKEKKRIQHRIFSLLGLVIVLLFGSTLIYSHLEGWGFLDSLYFSTTTMTTIGFGDMHPTTPVSKLFTIFFVLTGVAVMLYTLSQLGMYYLHYFDYHRPAIKENIKKTVKKFTFNNEPDKWVDIYRIKKK
ncbi:two pore domain potassium channel family protein [Candidatus Woesearchaeota archaeon]|nr:two pore domain potassium channel family protein [Candidatus Woesearchaeota archaeon]